MVDHVGGDVAPLARLEVEELAGAAEHEQAVDALGDQAVDVPVHRRRVVGVIRLEEGRQRRDHALQHRWLLEAGFTLGTATEGGAGRSGGAVDGRADTSRMRQSRTLVSYP